MNALSFLTATLSRFSGIVRESLCRVWGPVTSRAGTLNPRDMAHVLAVGCTAFASVLTVAATLSGDASSLLAAAAACLAMAGATFTKWASPPSPPS